MTFDVLVATMGRSDLSLVDTMNIRRDVVIANQCGEWRFDVEDRAFGKSRMISSATRGVGVNRNLALSLSDADIVLFADDDIIYYDSDLQGVIDAFEQLPDADIILFGIDMTRCGEIIDKRRTPVKRIHLFNGLKYGACRLAARRDALVKSNIQFSTLFGGGCIYGSGEDSLFLCDCFRAGLKIYTHTYVLGACAKDSSTWFTGFNEKYLFDKGAWIACAFPKWKHIIKWYFIWKFFKRSELSLKTAILQVNRGISAFHKLEAYSLNENR